MCTELSEQECKKLIMQFVFYTEALDFDRAKKCKSEIKALKKQGISDRKLQKIIKICNQELRGEICDLK